jgi:methionyl aminopeptidase
MGYHGFVGNICASINEEVVHGIPSRQRVLHEGDIIGIDFGVVHRGFVGDSAITVAVGAVSTTAQRLMQATQEALEAALKVCTPDHYIADIGRAIQAVVEPRGFSVVRNFVGHGVGTRMHEDPQVPHFFTGKSGPRLRPGLVIAIEPMINEGVFDVEVLSDGWTAVTKDRKLSAHFEHSVAITKDGPYVLSRLGGPRRTV